MYVTTSRKPSLSTKILASNLATFLNSKYEPRGKKSIEDVISRADELGYTRIIIVSETKGNPNKLSFIDISDEWRWVFPFIIFSVDTKFVHKKIGRINKEVEMIIKNSSKSEKAKRIADLFVIPEPTTDDTTKFIISDNSLLFKYKDKRMQLKIKELLESRRSEEHSD
ncbi:MAG: hypothetical protein QXO35_00440 [Candidatus Micrarchaeia archaeon]